MFDINQTIANELNVKASQVQAAIALLDDGSTVPFIARYRKEATDSLDDQQLRVLDERMHYFRELEARRTSILKSIDEQGKLTDELKTKIDQADTKTRLEDLYLPFKRKRQTKGQIAIAAGLLPLAEKLLTEPKAEPEVEAATYINAESGLTTTKEVLEGAKFILMERFAEDADLLSQLRTTMQDNGMLNVNVHEGKEQEGEKFRDYFDYSEALNKIPSHRALAVFRGRHDAVLSVKLELANVDEKPVHPCELSIAERNNLSVYGVNASVRELWLKEVVRWTWRIKLLTIIENDLLRDLRLKAEEGAIQVFAENLGDLLLAAPAGERATIGLDPGLRTGVKVAVVDATGTYRDHATIYPHPPQKKWDQALDQLAKLAKQHNAELLAVGNGTASRETEKLANELAGKYPELKLKTIMVSEAGASVYSASELASKEFPDLDVTIRGAVSIARRLQDPLAELVKIDPKSIGVGQYQHDVSQVRLAKSLDAVIEQCVNAVGVEVNTASAPLLSRVAGVSNSLAESIVDWRSEHGALTSRDQLKSIPRLGEKTFEQCAGFLRVRQSANPLDNSAVHPEAYAVVSSMAETAASDVSNLIGNRVVLRDLNAEAFVSGDIGLLTVKDILTELEKPGLDPRPEFKTATFKEGVEKLSDLKESMVLEGVVTNVTNFGAFVDVGVHQDGLVHISALADKFVKDPRDVVKTGQIVKVKVVEIDAKRKRIALTMKLADSPEKAEKRTAPSKKQNNSDKKSGSNMGARTKTSPLKTSKKEPPVSNAFAMAFDKAKSKS